MRMRIIRTRRRSVTAAILAAGCRWRVGARVLQGGRFGRSRGWRLPSSLSCSARCARWRERGQVCLSIKRSSCICQKVCSTTATTTFRRLKPFSRPDIPSSGTVKGHTIQHGAPSSNSKGAADEIAKAAASGASLTEMMDILDDSCFDGDICEFL